MRFNTFSTHTLAHRNHDFGLASSRPAVRTAWNRLLSLRQNALDPGFHGVLPGPAEPDVMLMVPA
jgi:hypothetical protein